MSKWLNLFLENEIVNKSDKSDRFEKDANLSGLSGRPQGLLDEKKVENNPRKGSDKSDRFKFESNMSPLSLRSQGLLNENLEKVGNNTSKGGDKSARFKLRANMSPNEGGLLSVLSVPTQGVLDQNLENMSKPKPYKPDKTDPEKHLSGLSGSLYGLFGKIPFTFSNGSDLLDEYEERIAIAEYDGHQSTTQAQRIAYLDAFVSVLATLPYENVEGDWLSHRIRAAQEWLLDQGIMQPK
jgi:hypothetical protein